MAAPIPVSTRNYDVLSNLMHNGGGKKGKLYRKGETIQLTDATAAPLLKSGVVKLAAK